jgi:hypothetical protein
MFFFFSKLVSVDLSKKETILKLGNTLKSKSDFSKLTTISHFPLLFLRNLKMSHGSAIFQVKDKCTSLVGSRNKLDHS